MSQDNLLIGVDWGTHSSKICIRKGHRVLAAPLFTSDILIEGDTVTFGVDGTSSRSTRVLTSLKAELIRGGALAKFWTEDHPQAPRLSTGALVAFSLANLLSSAAAWTEQKLSASLSEAELGFSFPNWVVETGNTPHAAVENFCQAVAVAVEIVHRIGPSRCPIPLKPCSIGELARAVDAVLRHRDFRCFSGLTPKRLNQELFHDETGQCKWRFIVESSAAGLPYLRAAELPNEPGVKGLLKVLVVDVGAGSTDVGYMLRTVHTDGSAQSFYHLPPAPSLATAGNDLTKEIQNYYRGRGLAMTFAEAEAQKLSTTRWAELPFVSEWIARIGKHIKQYVSQIPDERWLPTAKPFHLVLTGGSSIVRGLREAIRDAIRDGLRHIPPLARDQVTVVDEYEPKWNFRTRADIARRAVCFGAAEPDKPGFRYMARFEKYPEKPTVRVGPGWV